MNESGVFHENSKSGISQKLSSFVHSQVVCTLLHFSLPFTSWQEYVELQVTLYITNLSNFQMSQNLQIWHPPGFFFRSLFRVPLMRDFLLPNLSILVYLRPWLPREHDQIVVLSAPYVSMQSKETKRYVVEKCMETFTYLWYFISQKKMNFTFIFVFHRDFMNDKVIFAIFKF